MPTASDDEGLPFETRVLVSLAEIRGDVKQLLASRDDHETRLRKLEERASSPLRAYMAPVAGLASLGSLVIAFIAIWK